MYYDQIQGSMGFLGIPWWDFVVWTPQQTQIRRVEFDKEYFDQELFPRIETFYMTEYLPRAVLKRQGLLQPGKIDRTYTLFISEQPHDEEISQEPESAPPRLDWFTVKHTETETTNVTTYADDTFNKSTVQQQQQQ
jgi:hypothetical protein